MAIDPSRIQIDVGNRLEIVGTPVVNGNKITYTIRGKATGLATVRASYGGGTPKTDTIMVENKPVYESLESAHLEPTTGEDITVIASFDKIPLIEDYNAIPSGGLTEKVPPKVKGNTIEAVYTVQEVGPQSIIGTYDGESKKVTLNAAAPVTLKEIITNPTSVVNVGGLITLKLKF